MANSPRRQRSPVIHVAIQRGSVFAPPGFFFTPRFLAQLKKKRMFQRSSTRLGKPKCHHLCLIMVEGDGVGWRWEGGNFFSNITKWWVKWILPADSKWPFYPLVGGHLAFGRVTFSPSQKGHQQNCQVCNFCLLHFCSTSKYLAHPFNSAKHEKVDHPQISVFFFIAHNPHPFTPSGWENLRYPPWN